MEIPAVSIILPCYKVEDYIAKCILSVQEQTFDDWELLVIIDGSPDNSKQIAEELSLKDRRIEVYEKENGGLSDARNYGLERAKGDYIYFMDPDDWIDPNLLRENFSILDEERLDFIVFGYYVDYVDAKGHLKSSVKKAPKSILLQKGKEHLHLDFHHLGLLGYAWNKMYRKDFLIKHHFQFPKGISLVEDILFNVPVYMASDKIKFNPHCYYHYVQREEETLAKTFHANGFELKLKRNEALRSFFEAWKIQNRDALLSTSLLSGVLSSVRSLYVYNNQLTKKQRLDYIEEVISSPMVQEFKKGFKVTGLKNKVLCYLIFGKQDVLLSVLFKMRKLNIVN